MYLTLFSLLFSHMMLNLLHPIYIFSVARVILTKMMKLETKPLPPSDG